jgi:Fe-S cluster biogenesis protein NfuA
VPHLCPSDLGEYLLRNYVPGKGSTVTVNLKGKCDECSVTGLFDVDVKKV